MPTSRCYAPEKDLAEGCSFLEVPEDRIVRERGGAVFCRPLEFFKEYGVHLHTIAEELRTIRNRHMFDTPRPDLNSDAWGEFVRQMRWISRRIGKVPRAKFTALLKAKNGRKLQRYWGGIMKYLKDGVRAADGRIHQMQKLELYEREKLEVKEDRGIQFRSTVYNAALASHLWNIEHRLVHLHDRRGNRIVMKGLRPNERFQAIAGCLKDYEEPIFVLLDHSRFDAHVDVEMKKIGRRENVWCRGGNGECNWLLKQQESNIGYSEGGIRYKICGKVESGDPNTGLDNTKYNLAMLRAWVKSVRHRYLQYAKTTDVRRFLHNIFLDGDDSVVVFEKDALPFLNDFKEFFLKLGMETEGEIVDDFFKVEFCQARPSIINGQVVSVRDPLKVISTVGQNAAKLDPLSLQRVVYASLMCESAMNGVSCPVISPMLRRIYERLPENAGIQMTGDLYEKAERYGLDSSTFEGAVPVARVSELDRYYFWRTWDITPGEQLLMETQLVEFADLQHHESKPPRAKVCEYPVSWEWGIDLRGCDCHDCPVIDPDVALREALRFG